MDELRYICQDGLIFLNKNHSNFPTVFFEHYHALLNETNDEAYVCHMADYVRWINNMYMFVRVERPARSKKFVIAYMKCDQVFSFAYRFEQMRLRLNRVPPTLLTKVEIEENKALRLACIGETNYERALALHSNTFDEDSILLTPLGAAIYAKDEESAEALLDGEADPNEVGSPSWTVDGNVRNALHWAAEKGCRLPLFHRILGMIHNVNAVWDEFYRTTALMEAAYNNHLDMVVSLMNHPGIDLNVQDIKKITALHYAVAANHPAIVTQLLSDDRVATSLKDDENETPFKLAIRFGLDECVKILREHGVPEE